MGMKNFKLPRKTAIALSAMLYLVFQFSSAQSFFQVSDCGHWEVDTIVERIISTDTIKYNAKGDTTWVYSNWRYENNGITYAVHCPCGCGWTTIEIANRINDRGVNQKLEKITSYKYIERPKTKYEMKLEELKNRN